MLLYWDLMRNDSKMYKNMTNKNMISIKNIFIIAIITLIGFISIKILMRNIQPFISVFGDIFPIIINIWVVLTLFYATMRSKDSGMRVQMGCFYNLSICFFHNGEHIGTWYPSETLGTST